MVVLKPVSLVVVEAASYVVTFVKNSIAVQSLYGDRVNPQPGIRFAVSARNPKSYFGGLSAFAPHVLTHADIQRTNCSYKLLFTWGVACYREDLRRREFSLLV